MGVGGLWFELFPEDESLGKKVRWNDRVFGSGGCGDGGWGEEWGCGGERWVGGVGPQGNKGGVPLSFTFVLILNASM